MKRSKINLYIIQINEIVCIWDIFCIAIDISQAAATFEGRVSDAGHAVGDSYGGQAAAAIEGSASDAGHATGDNKV